MKINRSDIEVGYELLSFDDDDEKWYCAEVTKISPSRVHLKDIDPDSEWEGMDWDVAWSELENKELFKKIK
jgi:hypothetical protein